MADKAALEKARNLINSGEVDKGWSLCEEALVKDPNDPLWLIMATTAMDRTKHLPHAYQYAKRAVEMAPNTGVAWINFGRVAEELWRLEEAENAYNKALDLTTKPSEQEHAMLNLGALYISWGKWEEAERWSRKALNLNADSRKAKANLGMSLLAQRRWKAGWPLYSHYLGSPHRKFIQYADEPAWDGAKGKRVVVYGEQGLGDEICFASMIPDAEKDASLIIECDKRLEGLFKRSFPSAKVYGTRYDNGLDWAAEDQRFDASIAMAQLGEYYRPTTESFPGTPYLTADPDRVAMWKALWKGKKKPVIGVAWTGGVAWTAGHLRKLTLRELDPLFSSIDAHWVSLQYKDSQAEIDEYLAEFPGVDFKQYPYATLTKDYDDTAALVASLDAVVAIHTSVIHLAGALGIPAFVFVVKEAQWRYNGPDMPWYNSVKLYHKGSDWPIGKVIEDLNAIC